MIRAGVITLALLGSLGACTDPAKAILFDGMRYSGRLQADREDKARFSATAAPVSQGLDGAREAARYEGTRYCVRKYGSSIIDWSRSPDDEAETLSIVDDRLIVEGRCVQ